MVRGQMQVVFPQSVCPSAPWETEDEMAPKIRVAQEQE